MVFAGTFTAIGTFFFLIFILAVGPQEVSQEQIQSACASHGGVRQYIPTTWEAVEGVGTVVCMNGVVKEVDNED